MEMLLIWLYEIIIIYLEFVINNSSVLDEIKMKLTVSENELKTRLVQQSHEALKTLIQSAENFRRKKAKSANFFDLFYKEAKKLII